MPRSTTTTTKTARDDGRETVTAKDDVRETVTARLYDLHQSAAYCGVSYWTLREAVNAGHIPRVEFPSPHRRDGRTMRRVLVDRQDLDAYISRHKEQG